MIRRLIRGSLGNPDGVVVHGFPPFLGIIDFATTHKGSSRSGKCPLPGGSRALGQPAGHAVRRATNPSRIFDHGRIEDRAQFPHC